MHETQGLLDKQHYCWNRESRRTIIRNTRHGDERPGRRTACMLASLIQLGSKSYTHYYRKANLSRLGNPCCPGFPTGNARPGQKVLPAPRGWRTLLSRLVLPTGTKGPFFLFSFSQFFFYFNYTFAFQLNLCIGIQCV